LNASFRPSSTDWFLDGPRTISYDPRSRPHQVRSRAIGEWIFHTIGVSESPCTVFFDVNLKWKVFIF
jgi:hypothetical protein